MLTVKCTNGNVLTMHRSGGYKIWNLTRANTPAMQTSGYGYVFAKNMVYREAISNRSK